MAVNIAQVVFEAVRMQVADIEKTGQEITFDDLLDLSNEINEGINYQFSQIYQALSEAGLSEDDIYLAYEATVQARPDYPVLECGGFVPATKRSFHTIIEHGYILELIEFKKYCNSKKSQKPRKDFHTQANKYQSIIDDFLCYGKQYKII